MFSFLWKWPSWSCQTAKSLLLHFWCYSRGSPASNHLCNNYHYYAADYTAFPVASDNAPTCTLSCKAPCSPTQPRIDFLINTLLWASAPCLTVIYCISDRCLHSATDPSFSHKPMKGGSLTHRLSITCSVLPQPKAQALPQLWMLSSSTAKEPRWLELKIKKQGSYSTSFSCSCFVVSYNAFLPWVALWVVAQAVTLTYFIQLGKTRVDGLKRISKETVNGKEEEVRCVSDYTVTIQWWCK